MEQSAVVDLRSVTLWRRLDTPGHDTCRLERVDDGWHLAGTAIFAHEQGPAKLDYEVRCDGAWRSREGRVRGWVGARAIDVHIVRGDVWALNGAVVRRLEECVDLDFGFTPATNVTQLRRIALAVGEAADVPVAWWDPDEERKLVLLPQRYERRTESAYWYESPTANYAAELEVTPSGFTRVYPGLWQLESARSL